MPAEDEPPPIEDGDAAEEPGQADAAEDAGAADPMLFGLLSRQGQEDFEACMARARARAQARTARDAAIDSEADAEEDGYEVVDAEAEAGAGAGADADAGAGADAEAGADADAGEAERAAAADDAVGAGAEEGKEEDRQEDGPVGGAGGRPGASTSSAAAAPADDGSDPYREPFELLASSLGLAEYSKDVRTAARVDYLASVLQFARETCEMGAEQANVVVSVCSRILDAVVAGGSKEELVSLLKDALLPRLAPAPGRERLVALTGEDVRRVTDFVVGGLLRHRALYTLVFDAEAALENRRYHEVVVETPLLSLPLASALTEAQWERRCAAERRAKEDAEAALAAAAAREAVAKAAEAARRAEEEEEEARRAALAKKPATLEEAVEKLVLEKVEEARERMLEEHRQREAALLDRIAVLEGGGEEPDAEGEGDAS